MTPRAHCDACAARPRANLTLADGVLYRPECLAHAPVPTLPPIAGASDWLLAALGVARPAPAKRPARPTPATSQGAFA